MLRLVDEMKQRERVLESTSQAAKDRDAQARALADKVAELEARLNAEAKSGAERRAQVQELAKCVGQAAERPAGADASGRFQRELKEARTKAEALEVGCRGCA
jgi:hypothetical protein